MLLEPVLVRLNCESPHQSQTTLTVGEDHRTGRALICVALALGGGVAPWLLFETKFNQAAFLRLPEAEAPGCGRSPYGFHQHGYRRWQCWSKRRCTSRMRRREHRRFSVAGFRVACRAPRISSTIRGGSARLALV